MYKVKAWRIDAGGHTAYTWYTGPRGTKVRGRLATTTVITARGRRQRTIPRYILVYRNLLTLLRRRRRVLRVVYAAYSVFPLPLVVYSPKYCFARYGCYDSSRPRHNTTHLLHGINPERSEALLRKQTVSPYDRCWTSHSLIWRTGNKVPYHRGTRSIATV